MGYDKKSIPSLAIYKQSHMDIKFQVMAMASILNKATRDPERARIDREIDSRSRVRTTEVSHKMH